ncbi:MAG: hypothetical protein EOM14_12310 [Clostridia bacterium]|nr:hypothetical protein [Clostridia bacterium]
MKSEDLTLFSFLVTEGDMYTYMQPEWALFSYKLGGEWIASPSGWHVAGDAPENTGHLIVEIDRTLMKSDVRCVVSFFDSAGSLYIDLLDTNGVAIVEDVADGNLLSGTGSVVERDILLPLAANPDAWVIALRRGTGEILVLESLVYLPEGYEFSLSDLLNAARSELSESLAAVDTPPESGTAVDSSVASDDTDKENEDDAAAERKRERERRGERADTLGLVNLRVFTALE